MSEPGSPAVVLVRPSEEGNVGAAARAMANTGLSTLILVEPAVEIGATARAFAVGAEPILRRARRAGSLAAALGPYRRVVGTTSTRDRRLEVPLLTPRQLAERLAAEPPGRPTALVFGPERSGLNNDELALCGFLVRIPSAARQPTLNLGQAVMILAYELYLARAAAPGGEQASAAAPPATAAELEGLFEHLRRTLEAVGFARDDTAEGVLRDLRSLAARSSPTGREVTILRGICRRALRALERSGGGPTR